MSLNKKKIISSPKVRALYLRRRRILIRKIVLLFLLLAAVLFSLSYLSRQPKFVIQKIEIEGAKVISESVLKELVEGRISGNYLLLFSKRNFLIYPKRRIEEEILEKFKRIEELSLERSESNVLSVYIKERQGEYLLCGLENHCYFMDNFSYIFDEAPNFSGSVYFQFYADYFFKDDSEVVGRNFMPVDEFSKILDFKNKLGQFFKIKSLEAAENGEYKFSLEIDGNNLSPYVIFKKSKDFNKLLDNFILAIRTEPLAGEFKDLSGLEYFDLRYDNKVLYKFDE